MGYAGRPDACRPKPTNFICSLDVASAMSERTRQLLLTAAIVSMLSLGIGVAVAGDSGNDRHYCISWPPLTAGCPTTTVTVTEAASTATVTVPAVQPFYNVTFDGVTHPCWTLAQMQGITAGAVGDAPGFCVGVINSTRG